jgi:hypothetical protein
MFDPSVNDMPRSYAAKIAPTLQDEKVSLGALQRHDDSRELFHAGRIQWFEAAATCGGIDQGEAR